MQKIAISLLQEGWKIRVKSEKGAIGCIPAKPREGIKAGNLDPKIWKTQKGAQAWIDSEVGQTWVKAKWTLKVVPASDTNYNNV